MWDKTGDTLMIDASPDRRVQFLDADVIRRLLKIADLTVLTIGAGAIAAGSAVSLQSGITGPVIGYLALLIAFAATLAMRSLKLYDIGGLIGGWRDLISSFCVAFIAGGVVFALAHLTLLPMRPSWLTSWAILSAAHILLTRGALIVWAKPQAARGRFRKRIAIVGGGIAAEDAIHLLEQSDQLDIEIVGLFDDRYDERSPESVRRHQKIGKMADLADFARNHRVDLIIVAIPLSAEARLLHILKKLWELPVDIRISGQTSGLKFSPRAYTYLGKLPLLSVFDRPLSSWAKFVKGGIDRVLAVIALVLLSPLMLATALAVRLESKGPVIFKQRRYGFNNELVEVYKFRSMYTDRADATAAKLVTRNDPRVTGVGRFIRKSSIDELPQLFNVLTGQLSLVGPRPHATQAKAADTLYEQVVEGYFARHKVKPGITGWAQICGWRGETDTREKLEQRVKYDLDYIDRWSVWFDFYIMLNTPLALLKTQNAY